MVIVHRCVNWYARIILGYVEPGREFSSFSIGLLNSILRYCLNDRLSSLSIVVLVVSVLRAHI
jgi:hypothetical protein